MNQTKRRSDSIIPLSREHHHALVLCLRIHRGVEKHKNDLNWLQKQLRKTLGFFDSNLPAHFETEETVLFPAMAVIGETADLIITLIDEHQEIRKKVNDLRGMQSSAELEILANALNDFADFLEMHIRKEERQLFPIYDQKITPEVDSVIGKEIQSRIGTGMQPKHPELLQ